jgi:hypothetical protein
MPRLVAGLPAGIVAVLLLAACGGVQTTGEHKVAPAVAAVHPPGPSPAPPAVAAQVRRTWVMFFDGSTSLRRRENLLQNGSKFAAALKALGRSALGSRAAAVVGTVQLEGSTATISYGLTVDGKPVPVPDAGQAVRLGSRWMVSDATFCGLLELAGSGLPAACPKLAPPASPGASPPAAHG